MLAIVEIDDNQAGSFTLDATFSDPEFSYDRQADDSMGFSSTVNSPPTAIEDSVGLYRLCKGLHSSFYKGEEATHQA